MRFCPCWDQYHSAEGSVYISRAFWLSRTPPLQPEQGSLGTGWHHWRPECLRVIEGGSAPGWVRHWWPSRSERSPILPLRVLTPCWAGPLSLQWLYYELELGDHTMSHSAPLLI